MPKSYFKFAGGEQLTRIGVSWFVSYMYYKIKDKSHKNWGNVSNSSYRKNKYNKCS